MPGLFDIIEQMMGRPDPVAQLAAGLGQGPNQAGSPSGPQPLAAGGGASAPPPTGAPPDATGGAPPAAPPQPQAYQSPPDMQQMYAQLLQRQQGGEMFNRGLGMLLSSAARPWNRQAIQQQWSGMTPDAGDVMGNVMKLQMYQQQQQRLQGLQASVPGLVKAYNLDPAMIPVLQNDPASIDSLIQSHQPTGIYANWLLGREDYVKNNADPNNPTSVAKARSDYEAKVPLINALTPSGGDPTLNAFNLEHNDYLSKHGQQEPADGRFASPEALAAYKAQTAGRAQAQQVAAGGLAALQGGLDYMKNNVTDIAQNPKLTGLLTKVQNYPLLLSAARQAGWGVEAVAKKFPTLGLDQDEVDLLHKIDDLTIYRTDDLKSAAPALRGQIGTIESQQGTLQQFNSGPDNWKKNLGGLNEAIDATSANGAAAAGQLKSVLDKKDSDYEMKIDPSYLPGGQNYLGEPKQMSASDLADARQAILQWEKQYPGQGRIRYIRHLMLQGYAPPSAL